MSRRTPGSEYISRKEGGSFSLDFTIEGVRFRETCGTTDPKLAAAFALRRHGEEYRRLVLGEVARGEISPGAACARFHAEVGTGTAYGDGAQRDHMRAIERHIGAARSLAALDDATVGRFVQAMRTEKDRSPATINRHLSTLQAVCKRARDVWGVAVGPWTAARHMQREPEGREVLLTPEQARAFLAAVCEHVEPIIRLDCLTGLRRGNLLGLRWEQVSLDLGRAVLLQKGGRRLGVALVPAAVELLTVLQPDPSQRTGPVFVFGNPQVGCRCAACLSPAKRGKPITSIRTAFATAAKRAGVNHMPAGRLRLHDLRHSFASWLLAKSGNLKLVQEALGHAQIRTTMRYAHLMDGAKAQATNLVAEDLVEPTTMRRMA